MWRGGMDMQLAELAAEGEMLVWGDVLIPEEDHEIFGQRAVDLVHGPVGERTSEIDARYFRADDRGQLFDPDGLVLPGFLGDVPIAGSLLAGERTPGGSSGAMLFGAS